METGHNVLEVVFGPEAGKALVGAATKIARRHGIDRDDVIQEMYLAGMQVQSEQGFLNINTTVKRTVGAISQGYEYGVNRYYHEQGYREEGDEIKTHDGEAVSVFDVTPADFSWETIDTRLDVRSQVSAMSERERGLCEALAVSGRTHGGRCTAGYTQKDMADAMGVSPSVLSKAKNRLAEEFSWYLD